MASLLHGAHELLIIAYNWCYSSTVHVLSRQLPLFPCRTTAIPAVARCKPTPMQQLWRMMTLIQQQLLPVVSKKLKDSLLNSFFTCSSAKAHNIMQYIQYLFCCNNVASCSLKPRVRGFLQLYMRFIYCGMKYVGSIQSKCRRQRRLDMAHIYAVVT